MPSEGREGVKVQKNGRRAPRYHLVFTDFLLDLFNLYIYHQRLPTLTNMKGLVELESGA